MKYIKPREIFLKESKDLVKDNTLDILAAHDQGQPPETKNTIDKLDQETTSKPVVVRFAPSPTGFLHSGGIRTALYNYLFARKNNGTFVVRIEDTDQKRFVKGAEDYIKNSLEWLGIEPDESPWKGGPNAPYRQSERDYSKHIKTLIDNGSAYYAFDTEEDMKKARELDKNFAYCPKNRMNMKNSLSMSKEEVDQYLKEGKPHVIRFKIPDENREIIFEDIIRGKITFNTNVLDDKVLVKSNGIGTYHFCNISDDHDMGVTHVIRGEEWLSSAPLHILLYEAFGWTPPKFAHLPLLLGPKGKLSKRHSLKFGFPIFPFGGEGEDENGNKVMFKGFKDEGYEPDAVINFLLLLGWAPSDNTELFSIGDMISKFELGNVHKAGAKFDIEKLKWFNQNYIQNFRTNDVLLKHIDLGTHFDYDEEKIDMIINIAKKRSTFTKEMQKTADIFLKPIILTQEDKDDIDPEFKTVFSKFIEKSNSITWDQQNIKQLIFDICAEQNIKLGKTMPSLRIALTGDQPGPDLMDTLYILGKEESIRRISQAIG